MPAVNLSFIQQEMIRYGMSIYLALGLVGNICNCIIFTHHSHRHMASSIYLLTLSIFANIYLIWSFVPHLYILDHSDPQTQSLLYCKMRLYGSHVLGQYLRYTVVFACVDRFFVTRTNIHTRSLNSVSTAKKLVFIMCVMWLVIAIHIPILMTIRGDICGMFGIYKLIYAIYYLVVVGTLPPILMCIFSMLTIRTLHQRHGGQVHARQRDRCLMRMIIAEVIVNIITTIPYSINLVYGSITYDVVNKSAERLEIEAFCAFFTQFLLYLIGVVPFYLFLLTSKPFRHEFLNIIAEYWNKYILRQVRVIPLNDQNHTAITNGTLAHRR